MGLVSGVLLGRCSRHSRMDMDMETGMREKLICSWMRLVSHSVLLSFCCLACTDGDCVIAVEDLELLAQTDNTADTGPGPGRELVRQERPPKQVSRFFQGVFTWPGALLRSRTNVMGLYRVEFLHYPPSRHGL